MGFSTPPLEASPHAHQPCCERKLAQVVARLGGVDWKPHVSVVWQRTRPTLLLASAATWFEKAAETSAAKNAPLLQSEAGGVHGIHGT